MPLESSRPDVDLLRRLQALAELLPALFRTVDLVEMSGLLSSVPTDVLRHDSIAIDLGGSDADAVAPTPQLLRVAIRLDGTVLGVLSIASREPQPYTPDDLAIATRLAGYVALAVSHQRLADENRRSAALRERAANLEMLDGLLNTLAGVLDVREVFDRVSAVADSVLPHDALSIAEIVDNGARVRIHASHGLGNLPAPYDIDMPDTSLVTDDWEVRLIDDVLERPEYAKGPGFAAGMRSMLFVSIRLEGRPFGGLNFYSKTPGFYTKAHALVARRITDHVALALSHRRLAEQARQNEELRARTTNLELLDELLIALIDTGGVREVFDRISAIAGKVLPHDAAALMVRLLDDGRRARVYATAGFSVALPDTREIPEELLANPEWEHDIFDDIASRGPRYEPTANRGMRSLIRVPIRLDGQFAGALVFFSTRLAAFKPADILVLRRIADRIAVTLARDRGLDASRRADEAAARAEKLESRVRALTEELDVRTGYRRVVGTSREWRQVLTQATQVAPTETTVLLLGESGTGKEVVARFLHRASPRSAGPFVALNCAALPEQLLEAELFGYERGAYTGATQSKPGQLEQAAGGTLFLDEVAEMSPSAQAKFLRVLQEREFQRLGGTRVLRTDARIVAATNRDLPKAIAQGLFREDLYYRLNVFAIQLPPLRERRDDVLPLCDAFVAEIGRGLGRPPAGIARDARQLLVDYHWPGNVRELRNILERAAILCEGGLITAEFLALAPPQARTAPAAIQSASAAAPPQAPAASPQAPAATDLNAVERGMIEQALKTARFNKSKAAKSLGLSRQQLYIRMRKHGLG